MMRVSVWWRAGRQSPEHGAIVAEPIVAQMLELMAEV